MQYRIYVRGTKPKIFRLLARRREKNSLFYGKEVFKMKIPTMKIIGAAATLISIAATLVGNYTSKKQQDDMISKKIAETLLQNKKGS